jgi:hypothetical protein
MKSICMNAFTGGLEDWLFFVGMITAKASMKNSGTAVEFMISSGGGQLQIF